MALLVLVSFAALTSPTAVGAQEIEPRTYANTPVGMNFLAVGYSYSSGNIFMDPSSPTQGVSLPLASGRTFQAGPDFDVVDLAYQVAWGGK